MKCCNRVKCSQVPSKLLFRMRQWILSELSSGPNDLQTRHVIHQLTNPFFIRLYLTLHVHIPKTLAYFENLKTKKKKKKKKHRPPQGPTWALNSRCVRHLPTFRRPHGDSFRVRVIQRARNSQYACPRAAISRESPMNLANAYTSILCIYLSYYICTHLLSTHRSRRADDGGPRKCNALYGRSSAIERRKKFKYLAQVGQRRSLNGAPCQV